MTESRRRKLLRTLDWIDNRWPNLQAGVLFFGWLRGLIITPMTLPLAVVFTLGCLALAVIFPRFVNPFLDTVAEECVTVVVNVIRFNVYVLWPFILEYLSPLILVLAEQRFSWPLLWSQAKVDMLACYDLCPGQAHGVGKAQQLGQCKCERLASAGSRNSISKVPYRLYPLSCILLE